MNSIVKISAIILFGLIVQSCDQPVQFVVPNDIMPKDSMVTVMVDIHLVEGGKTGRKFMGDTLMVDHYYHKVLEKYQITKAYFTKSFNHYSSSPEDMDEIYEKVVERLNQMQTKAPKWEQDSATKYTVNKAKIDSIKALKDSSLTGSAKSNQVLSDK